MRDLDTFCENIFMWSFGIKHPRLIGFSMLCGKRNWESLAVRVDTLMLDFIGSSYVDPHRRTKQRQDDNPHCAQLAEAPVHADALTLILNHENAPRMKYVSRRGGEFRSILHRGQRKLLMSEIGALIMLDPMTEYTLVYAGAAPGIHIPFLSELFPNVTFHLYDPSAFQIRQSERIFLYNTFFTDSVAQSYRGRENLVFICDIRVAPDETLVLQDMLAQQRWHEIMQPELTSLKFRLPWPGEDHALSDFPLFSFEKINDETTVEYLDGEIHLPIWGRQSTTESRLVIRKRDHSGKKRYNCSAYEEEMSYFNRVVRPSIHAEQPVRRNGLDGCFDCAAEVELLTRYAGLKEIPEDDLIEFVANLSARISRHLGVRI